MKQRNNRGFIAITSVIVLSIILIVLAQVLSSAGYFQADETLNYEFKELSYYTALSCIDYAYFRLERDPDYAGNETISVGEYSCDIDTITTEAPIGGGYPDLIITTQATTENSTTKLKLHIDAFLAILSFSEI